MTKPRWIRYSSPERGVEGLDVGAIRWADRAVPAWISRQRVRLTQFRSASGRVRLAAGGTDRDVVIGHD
jgi:hypothetical protein